MSARPPPVGRAGRKVSVTANTFSLSWRDDAEGFYHYDVSIEVIGATKPPSRKKAYEIVTRTQTDNPHIFTARAGFDGNKNLWSTRIFHFPNGRQEFLIPLRAPVPGAAPIAPPRKYVRVVVTYIRGVNKTMLRPYQRNEDRNAAQEQNALSTINALNVIVNSAPLIQGIRDGRRLFPEMEGKKTGPFHLVMGYFQSVRSIPSGLMVNVDIATGLILRPGPLFQVCLDFLNEPGRNRRGRELAGDALRLTRRDPSFRFLNHSLKGVKFRVIIRGRPDLENKILTVHGIVENAAQTPFEKGGERITVADHYQQHHNAIIRDHRMIGIKTYIGNVYPLQFCHVAHAQLYKRSLPKWIQDEVISSSKTSPQERLKRIRQARLDLGYDNSPWIHESGLSIRPEPMSGIAARIIDPPTLHFHLPGHNSPRHSISPKNDTSWKGAWDVRARTFAVAGRIVNKVGLINFAGMKEQETQRFYRDLRSILHEHGIVIHDQNPFLQTQEPAGVDEEWLRHWVQYHPADLIIAILPTNAPDIYRTVKRFGDVEAGVVTQCVRHGKKFDNQYLNNLSLKINAKLGGVNNYASGLEIFQQKNVIVFGADVSRPAAGLQPAIASVVSSWDDYGCQYMAQISIQPPQQEIISDLQKMVYEAVRFYFSQRTKRELPLSKRLPGAILFYRDGVSEGEYAAIAKEEIGSIRRALQQVVVEISERFNLQPPPQIPKLTFIVVGKRHHIRFFPDILSPQDPMNAADQTGNCRPGLVVDRDVTNPTEYNFYLQSHAALRNSTSRSSHYIVILDAINISPDLLQSISYALCHVYARASRSVSRPAPVYYADLVCRRARFHFDTEVATHLDYASDASGDQPFNIEHWKSHFKDIHVGMKGMMYFV